MLSQLNSIIIPDDAGLVRDCPVAATYRGSDYDAKYDRHTLIYDIMEAPDYGRLDNDGRDTGKLVAICPKLLNLEKVLRDGSFRTPYGRARISKISRYLRYDEVWLNAPGQARKVQFDHPRFSAQATVSPNEYSTFAGLNCVTTLSQNNRLEWIYDWCKYNVDMHGLEGVLFFDNRSTEYSLADIADTIANVRGLKAWRIVTAPFPFGPLGVRRKVGRSLFLQSALLNIARLRFLGQAAAVLSADIDELIYSTGQLSVFDAVKDARTGYLPIAGRWMVPDETNSHPPLHRDHIYRDGGNRRTPFKWLVCPDSLLGRRSWNTHGVLGRNFNKLLKAKHHGYWHCWAVNTNWKGHRVCDRIVKGHVDPLAQRILGAMFQHATIEKDVAE